MSHWRAGEQRPVDMAPGVQRRLVSVGERAMAVRFEMARGSSIPLHSHPHEQIGFVVAGSLRFTIGSETQLLKAGDGYAIPSNVLHGVEVPEDAVAIDIFSPIREEYLP